MYEPPTRRSIHSTGTRPTLLRVLNMNIGVVVTGVCSTPGRWHNNPSLTLSAAFNRPLYDSTLHHDEIASCERYCVSSATLSTPIDSEASGLDVDVFDISLDMRDRANPACAASRERTIGASCFGSPMSTARRARASGIHVDGSLACAASSTTTKSNGGNVCIASAPAPAFVASTTFAPRKIDDVASFLRFVPVLVSFRW
mmetsp:Transcript_6304/g.14009  ORF Transcript_6304/g.14009 Transcript_6304/m.14009 type:complete len:200 (+) Transcript_6304:297-896(+)